MVETKFLSSVTALDVIKNVNCDGKIALITGADSGIGYETARSMAISGIKVIMGSLYMDLAHQAIERIKKEMPSADLFALHLNLADLESVEKFVDSFLSLNLKLDILICNAGIMHSSTKLTKDGFESVFQVNYLSNLYLIELMEEKLIRSAPCRIVFLSSKAHKMSKLKGKNISADFLSPKNGLFFASAYANSKLCITLLARYLAKKYIHSSVTTYSVHPGCVRTNIIRVPSFIRKIPNPFLKSAEQGAATSVYCAVYPNIEHLSGRYFVNCKEGKPSLALEDDELAASLWKISHQMLDQWKYQTEKIKSKPLI